MVHQTVSPRERVGSGDETIHALGFILKTFLGLCILSDKQRLKHLIMVTESHCSMVTSSYVKAWEYASLS